MDSDEPQVAGHWRLARGVVARGGWTRRLVLAGVGLAMLVGLYIWIDWQAVLVSLAHVHPWPLVGALLLFVPQLLLSAERWRGLIADRCWLSFRQGFRLTMVANSLNLLLPSKLGDLAKGMLIPDRPLVERVSLTGRVVLEKIGDVAALLVWLAAGLLGVVWPVLAIAAGLWLGGLYVRYRLGRTASEVEMPTPLRLSRHYWVEFVGGSLVLWWLHLAQIALLLHACNVWASFEAMFARIPPAIFAGLLPISLWGLGTRDAVLVWMFSDIAPAASVAAAGLLSASRYLVPGLLGLPWLSGDFVRLSSWLATRRTPEPATPLANPSGLAGPLVVVKMPKV